jgi:cellulose biosynthesis protein BcsQ
MTVKIMVGGRKGGTGKTTVAKNLAAGCARAGLTTLLVDADGQANATSGMQVAPYDGFKALVLDDADWADLLRPVPEDFAGVQGMFVLPSHMGQKQVEENADSIPAIVERFAELDGQIDVVIVDTSPGATNAHIGLYYACDYIVLPVQCVMESILSLDDMMIFLENAKKTGAAVGYQTASFLGIVPNMLNASTNVHKTNHGFIQGQYFQRVTVFRPMRDLTVWQQASQYRTSIWHLADVGSHRERRDAKIAGMELQPLLNAVLKLARAESERVAV